MAGDIEGELSDEHLRNALSRCEVSVYHDAVWRITRDDRDPRDPTGSTKTSGRYNKKGEVTLYLSCDEATMHAEFIRRLTTNPADVARIATSNMASFELYAELERVLTVDPARMGIPPAFLSQPAIIGPDHQSAYPFTWRIASIARSMKVDALLVPSAFGRGKNLNVFDVVFPGDQRLKRIGGPYPLNLT